MRGCWGGGRGKDVVEWLTTIGPPPPWTPQIKVTIMGKNEICHPENLVAPFLVHPPPPFLSSNTSLGGAYFRSGTPAPATPEGFRRERWDPG